MIKWYRQRSVSHSLFHIGIIPGNYYTQFELTYNFHYRRHKLENSKHLYVGETGELQTSLCG